MVKIIETNLSLNGYDEIIDHQSRVIEVLSWEDFINEIKNCKSVSRTAALGSMDGITLPRESKIENLQYDDFHLICDVLNYHDVKTRKLAYLIQ